MSAMSYTPVDCDFHDRIEALATTRRRVQITHESGTDTQASAEGVIVDIYTESTKEEFLRLDDGTVIRLDRIRSMRRADSGT
jgi:Rho-binding antiterminator